MKILIVAMSDSIHTARWISQITSKKWELHLFPSIDTGEVHADLREITVYHSIYSRKKKKEKTIKIKGFQVRSKGLALFLRKALYKLFNNYRVRFLKKIIKKVQPDIIHSLETQHAGYLVMDVKENFQGKFPTWIHTNWGSDIYLFGRLKEHQHKIRKVLANCDYYSCECKRDVALSKKFGFKGEVLPVHPNTGGFDLSHISKLRYSGPVSYRRYIMLKGYQDWARRALVGLRALERCQDLLKDYELIIYSTEGKDVLIAAELFSISTGIPVKIVPKQTAHEEILKLHGHSRISIGLSISDAISTSFLESIVMGAFPIQSWKSCANEWIIDGKTGILVPPDDPDVIELAIRKALTDDDLVNKASVLNLELAKQKLDQQYLKEKAIKLYNYVYSKSEVKR